ncbi:hypothetical protein EJF18_40622 [Clavispora lusitaniae]|uniref:Uncharacterized protein n=1 Tax=Clavispora lusitaniae TaxID=36911 RepID=A0ACD0WM26_CLALS|nr:hypothetical protein EJF14_40622 [Clavispora lusitaniae]QFZ34242.1 hypothetical protein EJF16_40622 [Clavispora lusitaniae]QFZ39926.1 hypothetical protein EJF15_40622 [Clavispora lusitaniae]QFZ45608.1 hypothetical protein EJF18_40622 [Clavispora lusitaniae]QFZ51272.1 hypothetical protein EJF17_40622 [Clavispora lusitaniae]
MSSNHSTEFSPQNSLPILDLYDSAYESDAQSLRSSQCSTTATSITADTESGFSKTMQSKITSDSLQKTCNSILARAPQFEVVLDCLHDMALQENAQIEECLKEALRSLSECVPLNTFVVPKDNLFPQSGRLRDR